VPPLQPGGPGEGRGEDPDRTPDDALDHPGYRAPLPPEDRIWRHPSELGAVAAPERRRRPGARAVAAAAAGALLVGGAAVVLDAGGEGAPTTSTTLAAAVDTALTAPRAPAWLGVHGTDATAGDGGALVGQVAADGPGHRAGLRPGDVVARVDGRPTGSMHDLVLALRRHAPGDVVVLAVVRDGAWRDVRVRLDAWPED